MNENINIKPIILPPFKRLCMTIGELPSSYVETMSYYEMLLWFTKYLGETVIPAIDNNAEALKEVQSLFIELQDYVNNYFENLDVQTEIDNKLDEMADSGQLADIIAQYLEVASVLGFDTKSDLKNAENLVDGSIAKTLGDSTYNDGKGNFYKIREITNEDVVDDDNIIALTNYPTLVAEKLPNYYINTINDNLEILNEKTNGYIGLTRIGHDEAWNYVYSPNGIDFYPVGDYVTNTVGDASSFIEINGTFYIVGSNRYRFSKDLVNWSDEYYVLDGLNANTYPRVWATTFTYDEVNNKVYAYSSYQYANENFPIPIVNISTGHYPFKIIVNEGTINANGTITFNQSFTDLLYSNGDSFYDPFVIKDNVQGLVFACVNSSTLKIEIRKLSNYVTIDTGFSTIVASPQGVEAPQLVTDNKGNIFCYVDCNWACDNTTLNNGNTSPHVNGYFKVSHTNGFYNSNQMKLIPYKVFCDRHFRHLGISNASKHALNCAEKVGIRVVPTHYSNNSNIENGRIYINSVNNGTIINSPSVIWDIPGSASVYVKALFKEEPLVFKGAFETQWKAGSDIPNYAENKYFTGKWSRQQVVVYPNANDGTIDVPFDSE